MNGDGWCTVKDSLTHHSRLSRSGICLLFLPVCIVLCCLLFYSLFLFLFLLFACLTIDRIIQGLKDLPLSLLYLNIKTSDANLFKD